MKYFLIMIFVMIASPMAYADQVIVKQSPTIIVQDHGNSFAADVARAYVNHNDNHVIFYNDNDNDRPYYNYGYDPHSPAAELGSVCGNVKPRNYQSCVNDYIKARQKVIDKYKE